MNNPEVKKRIKLLALLIILLSFMSYARNRVWESGITLWEDLGVNYCKQKKYHQALLSTSKALLLNPLYADAFLNRGNVYDELGQPYKAIEDYTNALALRPRDSYALYNRAAVYSGIGRTDEAIADFMKSCELGNHAGCETVESLRH